MRKGRVKQAVSGFLTAVTLFGSVFQPMAVYAAEPAVVKEKPPLYKEVKQLLDEDEAVFASDYEMAAGCHFDAEKDFSGIEIKDADKVKVTFEEALNEQGEEFSTAHADTYEAVYYVEPKNPSHPRYQISRKLIVRESVTEKVTEAVTEAEGNSGGTEDESESGDEDADSQREPESVLSEKEFDHVLEEAEKQDTVDTETGLSLGEVMLQAVEQGVDILELKEGESLTFTARSTKLFAARASQQVTVTQGSWYYYADYGLGTYLTCPYTVKFGSVTATAYCVQPSKAGPGNGNYTITKLTDGKNLAKVCYYGTKASGDEGFFAEKHPDFSTGKRFIITHLAAAYANGSGDAFSGTNETGKKLAMELYNFCVSQPDIPDVAMSFTNDNVKAYVDGNSQRTEEITFRADKLQSITMKLPAGVKFHNVTTGKTSAAGASVEVEGGTKFYLSAPLTQVSDVAAAWSVTMKGSITKDYSAYKIMTGSGTQDLALVFGEGVDDEKYIDFKVTWVSQASVELIKKDGKSGTALSGAVYGIYRDEACTQLITKMPATDKNGASSITIENPQETVYLKEITAPKGYVLDVKSYGVQVKIGGTVAKTVTDTEQTASLTIYKEGEVLTGASVSESGVTFQYSMQKQKGAVYDIHAGADIVAADGSVIYRKGDLIKENVTTGNDGSAVLTGLPLGTYSITETKAPENLLCSGETKTVTLSYAGQNEAVAFGTVTFINDRQKAAVSVVKQDNETKNPLDGGIYGLFAGNDILDVSGKKIVDKDMLIEKAITSGDGKAVYQSDLPVGNSYYVKELQAPNLYFRNSEDVFAFTFTFAGEDQAVVEFSHTFVNERVDAAIKLIKKDAETGESPQGDATLEGAVYGLYAKEDIVHPDGKTGVIYKAGQKVAELKTDASGCASVDNLYLGKYYIQEISPSEGYLIDEKSYSLAMDYEGDLVKTVEKTATSPEEVMKQPFQLIKVSNSDTDAPLLEGAGFSAYLVSSLTVKEDGNYDFDSAKPVVIGENGATEIFSDKKGYVCSIPIPYGTYLIRETTTPHNYKPVKDFIVKITEHNPDEPQTWRVLLDDAFEAKLKITKKDDETHRSVLVAGTEFKIYDLDNKKYVEQVTTYPEITKHTSYFTDENGYLILPNNLKIGHYRIEEVTAPNGYTLNENYFEVAVDSDTAYLMESSTGDAVICVDYENHPVKGEIRIEKLGDALTGYEDGKFIYEQKPLAGVEFEITAAEDIYTADHQKDSTGNRYKEYSKGDVVASVKTDENGNAVVENLPLGTYLVKEIHTLEGFVLDTKPQTVELTFKDQNTPVVSGTLSFENVHQKVKIRVLKQDAEDEKPLAGAEFALYNAEDISADGEILVKADTLIEQKATDKNGRIVFAADLPVDGKYYIREIAAPDGYVLNSEEQEFAFEYAGEDHAEAEYEFVFENERIPEPKPEEPKPEEPEKDNPKEDTPKQDVPKEDVPKDSVPDTPKTGDNRHPMLWMLLLLLAGGGISGSVWYLKRRKE